MRPLTPRTPKESPTAAQPTFSRVRSNDCRFWPPKTTTPEADPSGRRPAACGHHSASDSPPISFRSKCASTRPRREPESSTDACRTAPGASPSNPACQPHTPSASASDPRACASWPSRRHASRASPTSTLTPVGKPDAGAAPPACSRCFSAAASSTRTCAAGTRICTTPLPLRHASHPPPRVTCTSGSEASAPSV